LFAADSEAALSLIELLADLSEGPERWSWALCGMDRLLEDFALAPAVRLRVVEASRLAAPAEGCA
jgi:hypothetical protein